MKCKISNKDRLGGGRRDMGRGTGGQGTGGGGRGRGRGVGEERVEGVGRKGEGTYRKYSWQP